MAWSVTRRATDEDYELLEKRAAAFIGRHQITWHEGDSAVGAVELEIEWLRLPDSNEFQQMEGKRLERLWKRICNRAIGDDGICFGSVGHSVD